MNKKIQELILKVLGICIPFAALLFVAEKIWQARFQLFQNMEPLHAILIIVFGGMLYAVDNIFLVLAWRRLIDWFGSTKTNWKTSLKVYGSTQIAKYLPGNFVQFPSRHILGTKAGLKHAPLLGAAIFEILGLVVVSSLIYIMGNLFFVSKTISLPSVILIFILTLIFPFAIQNLFSRVSALRKMDLFPSGVYSMYKGLVITWLIYLAFFLVAGLVMWIIIIGVDGSRYSPPLIIVFSTYAVSWLIGTISPGMPGGLGVREAISIYILSNYLGETTSILVTLLSRIVTVFGDFYFYFFVRLIR